MREALAQKAELFEGVPNLAFEEWYQQGMECHTAALPRQLRKQALRALVAKWQSADRRIERWHLGAFALGASGRDSVGIRDRQVPDSYRWPQPPDPSWMLVVCAYPDGCIDLDFLHPVSGRFWTEDNGWLATLEHRGHFNKRWYESMGFEVLSMMTVATYAPRAQQEHLKLV